ncbi:COG3628 Phage baseplate assembly protein W [uncultured Caudovirales phage]|uniref:COG3628 Phage baseplate assembly protein W n=1 Tax=uncultured Caudovirales phage TaxID=2100421 RepID=A0A6J5T5Q7_9CAUD|nr:COG3628 Phage baseplate assembly protein W [uncultured Caudovirales phage]CAB4170366.1 COG3628 Phage baseplate assembly protein W [uncultured Caudovirales phage]CAB4176795.1 COG3628 Phage baseplate assembly protein W [uncultured Caudovirales phage]CAB4222989.1 COG3628 Phage baseplate assembly protein W [uncultured Caudovirales phage]
MARNTRTFSDIDLNFTAHPVTHDITVKYDEQAIKQSVKNLIMTNNFERPFHSEIGSQIRALLFEPAGIMLNIALKRAISDTILNFEPRVNLLSVEVVSDIDSNSVQVTIQFAIVNTERPIQLQLILYRTR